MLSKTEKYHYGLLRGLILNKDFDPITQIFYGDRILCPTLFGYTWATITNENTLWATSDVHFFVMERIDGLYKLSFYGDNRVLESIAKWNIEDV